MTGRAGGRRKCPRARPTRPRARPTRPRARQARPRGWQARPRWRITRGKEIALGPGKADLLEAIGRTGSISAAGRALGMSYMRAWLLVATMNRCFAKPLVITSSRRSSGASLSRDGRRALALYRRLETRSVTATRTLRDDLEALLHDGTARRRRP